MPKTRSLFDSMKIYTDRFWIGLFIQNQIYYWGDKKELEDHERNLFPTHNYTGQKPRCAVYENKSVEFIQCSCRNFGLSDEASNYSRFSTFDAICVETSTRKTTATTKTKTTPESRTTTELAPFTQLIITTKKELTSGGMTSDASFMKSSQTISAAESKTTSEGFTTTELTTASSTSTKKEERCCCCCWRNTTTVLTIEALREIFPPRKETSRYKRSKESAPDERKSSKAIAGVAMVVMSVPVVLIVTSDILNFIQSAFFQNLILKFKTRPTKIKQHKHMFNV